MPLILLVYTMTVRAQTSGITGVVIDRMGNPVTYANVRIEPASHGTTAGDSGNFIISQMPAGAYTLKVSCVGYQPQQRSIILDVGESVHIEFILEEATAQLAMVTVTATRNERQLEDIPMPIQIISREQIEQMGSLRLNEVLMEQTGLQIVSDHGTGLQMQGLSSDYILVLIDGEPVIGRTAGTLDLTRLTVGNIERIEIIKGPSSALYGSEAMAGVVNIITKDGSYGLQASLRGRYRTYNTWDLNAETGYRTEQFAAQVFVNRLSSDGYDLTPESVAKTVPQYRAYTVNPKFEYKFSNHWKVSISGRYYTEHQHNLLELASEDGNILLDEYGWRKDWALMPQVEFKSGDKHRVNVRYYTTGYQTHSQFTYQTGRTIYDENFFNQTFNRTEVQYDWYISDHHITTLGLGHIMEQVEATRYDDISYFTSHYAFAQHQWAPDDQWNIIVGGRWDIHNQYADRFSPKLSAGYKPWQWLHLQASIGGGYKAPDFRQLLLSFTNAVAGYSVFGSNVVREKMTELVKQGQIETIYIDPHTIHEIKAESSLAVNAGFVLYPVKGIVLRTNFFYNHIQDLIETAPVALKTNGQNIFSYFNIASVITQGIEASLDYQVVDGITVGLGYQYMDSRDKDAWQKVKEGKVFRRNPVNNRTEKLGVSDYGGLFNRSRYAGNVKLLYKNEQYLFSIALRGIYRGRWGTGDVNGNLILDDEREYANGYMLWNLSLNKQSFDWLRLEAGINNLSNETNISEPSLAGRLWYVGAGVNLSEIIKTK